MRQSTNATPPGCASQRKIDCPGPLDNLHVIRKTDNHSKNVVLYSRLSVLVERMTWKLWAISGVSYKVDYLADELNT